MGLSYKFKSGIKKITKFNVDNYPCKIAGSINDSDINSDVVSLRDQRKIDRFITLGLIAVEAINDSGFVSDTENSNRSGDGRFWNWRFRHNLQKLLYFR